MKMPVCSGQRLTAGYEVFGVTGIVREGPCRGQAGVNDRPQDAKPAFGREGHYFAKDPAQR